MPTLPARKRYTWAPDLPDQRDHLFSTNFKTVRRPARPPVVDLRSKMPPVFDQGDLGSCTGNALCGQLGFLHPSVSLFSRLFVYYGERVLEGTVNNDSGAQIRSGVKFMAKSGAPAETMWPYVVERFTAKPDTAAYTAALAFKIGNYARLLTLNDMIDCLALGMPFVFGFTVYESFESEAVAATGVLNMPGKNERAIGGHAVMAVGYDMTTRRFLIRNSWGSAWGQGGHFTIPFSYLTNRNLSDDFWVIRK